MQGEVPMMFEIVAVGAIASTLEFRIPCAAIFSRSGSQSRRPAARHLDGHAALRLEQLEGVVRQQAAIPFRAGIATGSAPRSAARSLEAS